MISGPLQSVVYVLTLQFLPYLIRALILAGLGVGIFAFASYPRPAGADGPVPLGRR